MAGLTTELETLDRKLAKAIEDEGSDRVRYALNNVRRAIASVADATRTDEHMRRDDG